MTAWTISEVDQLDSAAVDRLGSKLLIGNGYLGYRGTLEEYDASERPATIISGLYDKVGDLWREPVNMPNGGFLRLSLGGTPLHALQTRPTRHHQTLDVEHGIHERETVFGLADGTRVMVKSRRFVSLTALHLICFECSVEATHDCALDVVDGIDGRVWDINGPHLEDFELSIDASGAIVVAALSHDKKVPIAVAEAILVDGAPFAAADDESSIRGHDRRIVREFQLSLKAGEPRTIVKIVAHHSGLDAMDPAAAALVSVAEGVRTGFAALLAAHSGAWRDRWDSCDILIEGDPEAQQALRFSMYHLLAIAPTHADNVSIPARGLSGQVYKGGIFWDTEIFMVPFFSHAFPAIARNLLMYRYHTLEGARSKAAEYGFRGAFYAWESQDDGTDACTLFNITDVFTNRPMRTYFRDKQYHISADVVYAIWDYYTVTRDASIWVAGAAEVVFECARFFLTLAYFNHDKNRYEILDATGPDEYHERVNNNAYTNWMAAHTFDVCVAVADWMTENEPARAAELIDELDLGRDLETIREMSRLLYRPAPDPETHVVPQFDGYFGLEAISLEELLARRLHPHEYLGGGNGIATTTQILKQADVVLAMVLFPNLYSTEIKRINWEFYEPRTEGGSSLSACSYSLVAAEIGKIDWAYDYFMKAATIDLSGDSKQFVGTLYIGGTHPAASGGAWMSAVFGLCGVQCDGDILKIDPRLPAHWKSVRMPLAFGRGCLSLEISNERIVVTVTDPVLGGLSVCAWGVTRSLQGVGTLDFSPEREKQEA